MQSKMSKWWQAVSTMQVWPAASCKMATLETRLCKRSHVQRLQCMTRNLQLMYRMIVWYSYTEGCSTTASSLRWPLPRNHKQFIFSALCAQSDDGHEKWKNCSHDHRPQYWKECTVKLIYKCLDSTSTRFSWNTARARCRCNRNIVDHTWTNMMSRRDLMIWWF